MSEYFGISIVVNKSYSWSDSEPLSSEDDSEEAYSEEDSDEDDNSSFYYIGCFSSSVICIESLSEVLKRSIL